METNGAFAEALIKILVQEGVIAAKDVSQILQEFSKYSGDLFEEFLLTTELVSHEDLLEALSKHYRVPAIDVRGRFFDPGLIQTFPEDLLISNAVIPLTVDQSVLVAVAANPDQPGLGGEIEKYSGYVTEFRVGIPSDIIAMIRQYYGEEILTAQQMDQDEARELIEEDDLHRLW